MAPLSAPTHGIEVHLLPYKADEDASESCDTQSEAVSRRDQESLKLWAQLSRRETGLEPVSFCSSFVYQNGKRGQRDRSCQVLK